MNNVIKADFGGNPEPDIDKLYDDLDPILNDLTDTACASLGEEVIAGCSYGFFPSPLQILAILSRL